MEYWRKKGVLSNLLLPLSFIFYLLTCIRTALYRLGLCKTYTFPVPIIVIGNITAGGSGKTPLVIALVNFLKQQGWQVGIVSRGYGGKHTKGSLRVDADTSTQLAGDEPVLIAKRTQAPVAVNKKRAQAVYDLLSQHKLDVVISDDGLQHHAMARDIEIAVIDGALRFGNGRLLPAGSLRERPHRLKTVDFVIANGTKAQDHETRMRLIASELVNLKTKQHRQFADFQAGTVCAVAAIGNPQRFFELIRTHLSSQITHPIIWRVFTDHHAYQASDFANINADAILMTEKDAVKCAVFAADNMWYIPVSAELSDDFYSDLQTRLAQYKKAIPKTTQ